MARRYKIDPWEFTDASWGELFYNSSLLPDDFGFRHRAQPIFRGASRIHEAVGDLQSKIGSMQSGGLGPQTKRGENAAWIADLRQAIDALTRALKQEAK